MLPSELWVKAISKVQRKWALGNVSQDFRSCIELLNGQFDRKCPSVEALHTALTPDTDVRQWCTIVRCDYQLARLLGKTMPPPLDWHCYTTLVNEATRCRADGQTLPRVNPDTGVISDRLKILCGYALRANELAISYLIERLVETHCIEGLQYIIDHVNEPPVNSGGAGITRQQLRLQQVFNDVKCYECIFFYAIFHPDATAQSVTDIIYLVEIPNYQMVYALVLKAVMWTHELAPGEALTRRETMIRHGVKELIRNYSSGLRLDRFLSNMFTQFEWVVQWLVDEFGVTPPKVMPHERFNGTAVGDHAQFYYLGGVDTTTSEEEYSGIEDTDY